MSNILLADVKKSLRVTHTSDDDLLQRLIDSAELEVKRFLNRAQLPTNPLDYPEMSSNFDYISSEEIPSSGDPVAPDIYQAVILMVQADYDGDAKDRIALRTCAEALMMPYRTEIGV